MIEGLQIDVKSEELTKIMRARLEHHEAKAKTYGDEAKKLRESVARLDEDLEHGKVSNSNPAQSLDAKAREHADRAVWYRFMLDHVIQNEVYRLGQDDLARLGIATRGW